MEKKLTKKELKDLEEKQNELRIIRRKTLEAYQNYQKDIEATTRFYKINPDETKMKYGNLNLEEKLKLLRRYEELNFLKPYEEYTKEEQKVFQDRGWEFLRLMYWTQQEKENWKDHRLNETIDEDGIWNDEIIWSKEHLELYLKLAKKFGYTKLYYTNGSSGALANITDLVDFGAKVIGTCSKKDYDKQGLIFDLTQINIEED